jgi:phospholipase/carboxylesterase
MNSSAESGIHHVTLIARRVQANVDFYVAFLGLRLVKRIGGFEDGTPGSLVTFLVWEDGAPGRVGTGQVSEIALAVPQSSIGEWMTRALSQGVPVEGPVREFGEPVLRLKDPDGMIVKLVGADIASASHRGHDAVAGGRLRAVTILTDKPEEAMSFLERFGYGGRRNEGAITRMFSDTDAVDVRDASGYVAGLPGTGTVDHAAFRATDVDAVKKAEAEFSRLNSSPTNFHDRKYFTSLYVREPGGTLFELATEGPGFTTDEQPERLGETLFIPPGASDRTDDLKVMLPQFAMPGKPRMPRRELPFVHRLYVPEKPDESTIVLLHGTGGSEADLMPVAHRIAPQATLLGLRGRSHEEGVARWFRRLATTGFDQDDIKTEAEAFEAFVEGAISGYGLDRTRMTFLGYSNGANFIAAVMGLRHKTVRRAILLRSTPVLEAPPAVDLTGAKVLMLSGAHDPFGRNASVLQDWFRYSSAALDAHTFDAGHELVAMDTAFSREWLQQNGEGSES